MFEHISPQLTALRERWLNVISDELRKEREKDIRW